MYLGSSTFLDPGINLLLIIQVSPEKVLGSIGKRGQGMPGCQFQE